MANNFHVVTHDPIPHVDSKHQHRLTQDQIKQRVEASVAEHKRKGAQCENPECGKWFLFTDQNTCQQCTAPIHCKGCGRFLCTDCYDYAIQYFGREQEICNYHSNACAACVQE